MLVAEGPELSTVSREFTAGTNLTRLHLVDVASKAFWSRSYGSPHPYGMGERGCSHFPGKCGHGELLLNDYI